MTGSDEDIDGPAIVLCCPECGYRWSTAAMLAGVWWAQAVTPEAIAAKCWCPSCRAAPPMLPAPPAALTWLHPEGSEERPS